MSVYLPKLGILRPREYFWSTFVVVLYISHVSQCTCVMFYGLIQWFSTILDSKHPSISFQNLAVLNLN